MGLKEWLLRRMVGRANLHPRTVDFLKLASSFGLPSEVAIPKELLPLASQLVARGWANNAYFQVGHMLPMPLWAQLQYDPASAFFEPVGHQLLSMNTTLRNWTMVGIPGFEKEAIIDPAGMLMPHYEGAAFEFWAAYDGQIYRPQLASEIRQKRIGEFNPGVETLWVFKDFQVRLECWAEDTEGTQWAVMTAAIEPKGNKDRNKTFAASDVGGARLLFSIRPLGVEGLNPVDEIRSLGAHTIAVDDKIVKASWELHQSRTWLGELPFQDPYVKYIRSNFETGATYEGHTPSIADLEKNQTVSAEKGFAFTSSLRTASALIDCRQPQAQMAIRLEGTGDRFRPDRKTWVRLWKRRFNNLANFELPDARFQQATHAAIADLLMGFDGHSITPGPATYHHFWFRDSAYILPALLRAGATQIVRKVLHTYPDRQRKNGFFVSQDGEWDANGQALFAIEQFALYAPGVGLPQLYTDCIKKAAHWIERKRGSDRGLQAGYKGLLPPGLSAEHLGPNDSFYWDQFWSLKGLESAANLMLMAGEGNAAVEFSNLAADFRGSLEASLYHVSSRLGTKAMPASPRRGLDAGMIGSVAASHPLQLWEPTDPRIVETLEALQKVAWHDGLFYQIESHKALGTYLSQQVAHGLMFAGKVAEAMAITTKLVELATEPLTWPEGINPRTLGGGMGDGHHLWASADFVWHVHDMFAYNDGEHRLHLLAGVPHKWLKGKLKVSRLPIETGAVLDLTVTDGRIDVRSSRPMPHVFVHKHQKDGSVVTDQMEAGARQLVLSLD